YEKAVNNAKQIMESIADYEYQEITMNIPESNYLPSVFGDLEGFPINIQCQVFDIDNIPRFIELLKEVSSFGVSLSNDEQNYTICLTYKGVVKTIPGSESAVFDGSM
nr:hypothetical protein [Clostridiales bacterium]